MREFGELVAEARRVDVSGWGFGWLAGRATEERPPWGYASLMAGRLANAESAVDLDTGGGEVLAEAPAFPERMCATEGWTPNARLAQRRLSPRGARVVRATSAALPFADDSFDLVTSRHPVSPQWSEIARVLAPGGRYFAQHVGPASGIELIEQFLGPLPHDPAHRDPQGESAAATEAGLSIVDLRTVRCRMEFFDIGAVVYILRKCVWWVPDFSVEKYHEQLLRLDARIRADGPFVAHSTRHLIEAAA